MFHFGKSWKNPRGLIRRRRFDNLVAVQTRMTNVSSPKVEERAINAADWKDDYSIELLFKSAPDNSTPCKYNYKFDHMGRVHVTVKRMPKRHNLGDLFLEANPDGEEKAATRKARENEISNERSSRTWKNSNRAANRQWNRHEPTVHCAWSIGEETCATELVWESEDEPMRIEREEAIALAKEREQEFHDMIWHFEDSAFDRLKERYNYGFWNHDDTQFTPFLQAA